MKFKKHSPLSWIFSFFIYFYRCFLFPYFGGACRFYPTCSQYGQEAFLKFNFLKAFKMTFKRVLSCHPLGCSGYHPVEKNELIENE